MAGTFPTLRSGTTVLYPLKDTRSFGTGVQRFADDSEQRWRSRLMLARFEIQLNGINGYDLGKVLSFYRSQFGKYDSTWSLTIGGDTYNNLALDEDSLRFVETKPNHFDVTLKATQTVSDAPVIPASSVYFPQLNSRGLITGLPYATALAFKTSMETLPNGKRIAWKWRSTPLGTFTINLSNLSSTELETLRSFFYSVEGRLRSFVFLDPGGNLIQDSDDFSQWTLNGVAVSGTVTDVYRGALGRQLTTSGAKSLSTSILPLGGAAGLVMSASVWAKGNAPGQTVTLALDTLTRSFPLVSGVWTRLILSGAIGSSDPVTFTISGVPNGASLFSAQVSPTIAPGPRILTPGNYGYHAKCRFDTDDFELQHSGFNENGITLPITEFA